MKFHVLKQNPQFTLTFFALAARLGHGKLKGNFAGGEGGRSPAIKKVNFEKNRRNWKFPGILMSIPL